MHIRFADIDKNFIKAKVSQGFYTNETELVRDAVRRLREENEKNNSLTVAVMRGHDQIEAEQTNSYSHDLIDNIKKRGIKKAENGSTFNNTDALPNDYKS